MCLAIPAKIISIEDNMGTVDMAGIQKRISLILLEEPRVGDYVIVHAGFAIHRIDEEVAMESLRILREAAALLDDGSPEAPEEDEVTGFGTDTEHGA
jgi:hydrogenase expression/formation protein HypC